MAEEKQKRKRKGERPDGLIQVSYQVGIRPDGKPDRKYFYGHSRAEAVRKRDAFKRQFENGLTANENITLGEWIDICKNTYRSGVNQAYLQADAAPYERLKRELGHKKLKDIREYDLQASLNKLEGKSYSMVTRYRYVIHKVFEKARLNRYIVFSPAESLTLPKNTKGTHRALERWEIEHIFQHWQDLPSGLWFMIMMLAGLRRSEMVALTWENIDMNTGFLRVSQTAALSRTSTVIEHRAKSPAGLRTIPICSALYQVLDSVPPDERNGFVCNMGDSSVPLTLQQCDNALLKFNRVLSKALGKGQTFKFRNHDLRHTFATLLYEAGVSARAAQYFLGHSTLSMTVEIYTHLTNEHRKEQGEQMKTYLDGWLTEKIIQTDLVQIPAENAKK